MFKIPENATDTQNYIYNKNILLKIEASIILINVGRY